MSIQQEVVMRRFLAWTGFVCLVVVCLGPKVLAKGPSVPYDGSGVWHYVLQITNSGVEGLHSHDVIDEGDFFFTQDGEGNLHARQNTTEITLTRRNAGRMAIYEMSIYEPHPRCDTHLKGSAQIDTDTNTLHAVISGIEEGCDRVVFTFHMIRVSAAE